MKIKQVAVMITKIDIDTRGNLMFSNKALKKLIIPIFLEQLFIIFVGLISTMMLSRAGEAAVSGVSLVEMINFLVMSVLVSVSIGGSVVVSQYIGSNDKDSASHASGQLITITSIISLFITVVVLVLYNLILRVLFGNVESDVMTSAVIFMIFSAISYPFFAIYNSCTGLFRSMGNSKIPLIASIVMNVTNIVGNAIAIFVLDSGVLGVAIATLVARVIASALMLYLSFNKKNDVFITWKTIFSLNRELIRKILKIAVPNGMENGIVQLGRVALVSVIAVFGTTHIAANGIATNLGMIAVSFGIAINFAIVTVVGQTVGAGDYEQAEMYIKKLLKITYVGTLIINVAMLIFLPWILNLFQISQETRDLTFILLWIHNVMAIVLWPVSFTLPSGLRAAGDVRYSMILSIASMIVFRLLFSYILGLGFQMGVIGVWIAMCLDWVVRMIVFYARFKKGGWRKFRVL